MNTALPGFLPWDVANYSSASGGPLHVYPSIFSLGADEIPRIDPAAIPGPSGVYENLHDLGTLLEALTYFLKVSGPKGELSEYFVPEDQFASQLGDRNTKALFPREGRALVYGLAATVLQNLAAPKVGHLEEGSAGLKYHDVVSLDPRDPRYSQPATTLGVAKILLAARNFRQLVDPQHLDPDFPKSLLQYLPQVDNALLFGHIQLAAQNPCTDGGFGIVVEGGCQGNAAGGGRTLQDTVEALRAVTNIYNDVEQEVVLIKVKQAWQFLDQFWPHNSALPIEVLGLAPQPVQPSRMWEVLALWDDTQLKVTHKLANEVPWATWKARFDALKARMLAQLQTTTGPEPLVP
jgi:hypothetical protein